VALQTNGAIQVTGDASNTVAWSATVDVYMNGSLS
jgi:hypothetical protein